MADAGRGLLVAFQKLTLCSAESDVGDVAVAVVVDVVAAEEGEGDGCDEAAIASGVGVVCVPSGVASDVVVAEAEGVKISACPCVSASWLI